MYENNQYPKHYWIQFSKYCVSGRDAPSSSWVILFYIIQWCRCMYHHRLLLMFDLLWLQTSPGLEECMQSRPPLQLDLTGPKPTTYDPPTTLPWETSSPSYTMRPKTQPERGIATTVHMLSDIGEQGWHSDGSTCSRSMWPGLKSWCQHHMWVEFVVQFFLSFALRGFYSGFRLSSKTNICKFQFDEEW